MPRMPPRMPRHPRQLPRMPRRPGYRRMPPMGRSRPCPRPRTRVRGGGGIRGDYRGCRGIRGSYRGCRAPPPRRGPLRQDNCVLPWHFPTPPQPFLAKGARVLPHRSPNMTLFGISSFFHGVGGKFGIRGRGMSIVDQCTHLGRHLPTPSPAPPDKIPPISPFPPVPPSAAAAADGGHPR